MRKYNLAELFKKHNITGICFDSRKIKPGQAFFAIKGGAVDGSQYIEQALKDRASLIIKEGRANESSFDKILIVPNVRIALAEAAALFYPKLPEHLVAATGTNGKTSVVSYCQQLFALLGAPSASMGTIGIECSESMIQKQFNAERFDSLTTADPVSLREIFHKLKVNNINHVAFEASSHGLDQYRLGDVKVGAAAFTSFGHDHLDYHYTYDNYLQAKLKLFSDNLLPGGAAIISSEIAQLAQIIEFLKKYPIEILTVGNKGDVKISSAKQSLAGQKVNFTFQAKEYEFSSSVIGSYQASNLLIAALLVHKTGFAFENVVQQLPSVNAVKGRLERVISLASPFHIFVDYSHKPDALQSCLLELKKLKPANSKLVVVFGCGGNRDSEKRPLMGAIAQKLADIVIITDDNPRCEDAGLIRAAIRKAAPSSIEIGDRFEAISAAINTLKAGDILLIAGKGHEEYQIIGDKKIDFSDVKIAKKILEGN